ncbi:Pr6Pr family membrane protein [Frigoribacterium sp. 2-23]|uniref:Pr6Pr family membrane protein n=1 Tax=Frigoribacterium sp. 2-23 TaxID=3415006 RepID=UPI003C700E73
MSRVFAIVRLAAAIAIVVAVIGQLEVSLQSGIFNPFNFFGYFTIQSNLLLAVAFVVSAVTTMSGRTQGPLLVLFRGATVTYIATTGIVYNTLLANASMDNSFDLPWANDVLHKVIPIYGVLDWVLFGDRTRILWKRLGLFLVYPIVWLIVILIRGATDGFVPYPFLDPAIGYGVVTLYCIGIATFIALMSALVIWLSRYRVLRP